MDDDDFFASDSSNPPIIQQSVGDASLEAGYDFLGGPYDHNTNTAAMNDGMMGTMNMSYQPDDNSYYDHSQYATLDDDQMMTSAVHGSNSMEFMPPPEALADNALNKFMGEWEAKLRQKANDEETKKVETKKIAQQEHQKFSDERAMRRETRMNSNRTQEQVFLEQLESDLELENPWERIVSLVDIQTEPYGEFKDTTRMKSMFIQLKNDPLKANA